MNTSDKITSDMLENTEFHMGKGATKYEISSIIGSNDIYIYKETAVIDRDGPYLEPLGDNGEKGGHLLGTYKIKKDYIIIPDGLIYVNMENKETLYEKYLAFLEVR